MPYWIIVEGSSGNRFIHDQNYPMFDGDRMVKEIGYVDKTQAEHELYCTNQHGYGDTFCNHIDLESILP